MDPLGRPTVPAGGDHYFQTCFRPYTFQNLTNQNKRRVK